MDEQSYITGHRTAWRQLLEQACRELGYDDPDVSKANWISEREQAIVSLRKICETHGDNDWPNELHLSDIIEKHLHRHLK